MADEVFVPGNIVDIVSRSRRKCRHFQNMERNEDGSLTCLDCHGRPVDVCVSCDRYFSIDTLRKKGRRGRCGTCFNKEKRALASLKDDDSDSEDDSSSQGSSSEDYKRGDEDYVPDDSTSDDSSSSTSDDLDSIRERPVSPDFEHKYDNEEDGKDDDRPAVPPPPVLVVSRKRGHITPPPSPRKEQRVSPKRDTDYRPNEADMVEQNASLRRVRQRTCETGFGTVRRMVIV